MPAARARRRSYGHVMRADIVLRAPRPAVLVLAVGLPVAVCAVLTRFRDAVPAADAALVLVLVVVAAAATGMRSVGLAAALSAALSFDLFLTAPYGQLRIDDPADIETTVLLLAVGAAVTEIALWGRRLAAGASRAEGYLDGLLTADQAVATSRTPAVDIVEQVCRTIEDVLDLDRCRFTTEAPGGPVLADDGTLTRSGRHIDLSRHGLPTDTHLALPARSGGVVRGWFELTAATRVVRPTPGQLRIVVALAHQAGAALATTPVADSSRRATR